MFSKEEKKLMEKGGFVTIGNARYGICAKCGKIVRFNKPLFGSLHVCK